MAFPTRITARGAWERAEDLARLMKSDVVAVRGHSAAGTMTSSEVTDLARRLFDYKTEFNTLKLVPGVQAYAQAAVSDPALDVAAEFNGMIAAMDGVTSWLIANFPKTPTTNELRAQTWNADNSGRLVDVVFSAAATATFRTVLDTLISAVE